MSNSLTQLKKSLKSTAKEAKNGLKAELSQAKSQLESEAREQISDATSQLSSELRSSASQLQSEAISTVSTAVISQVPQISELIRPIVTDPNMAWIAPAVGLAATLFGNNGDGRDYEAEARMQRDQQEHEARMAAQARAHDAAMEKEKAAAAVRVQELANVAKQQELKAQAAAQEKANEQAKAMKKLEQQEAAKERAHKAAEAAREKEHQIHLQKIEQEKLKIQQETEAQEQKHQEDLKQMWIDAKEKDRANKEKQRDDALKRVKSVINDLETQKTKVKKELTDIKQEHQQIAENVKIQNNQIKTFDKVGKLKEERKEMERALGEYKRNDDEIIAAIDKTGQHEDNVGRFLRLQHALIGETVESQVQANKLDAELNTFSELLSRECQDKLEIATLFASERLDRFVPILTKNGYKECRELVVKNDEEFEKDILPIIDNAIYRQIQEWKRKHPNVEDGYEKFLDTYKLTKYKRGLRNANIESLEDFGDEDLDDEMIEEVITEAKITGLAKKKFKRAVKEVQSGKYKVADKDSADKEIAIKDSADKPVVNGDDTKEEVFDGIKPLEISSREERALKRICTEPDEWKELEREKENLTRLALLEMTPLLGRFFSKMDKAIKQSQKLLNYSERLNDEQNKAMSVLMDNIKPKAIQASSDDNKSNDPSNLPDYQQRKAWEEASEVQVYSESKDKWYNGQIIKVSGSSKQDIDVKYDVGGYERTKQVDRFGKDIRDPITVECRAITSAIIVDLNVVDIMEQEFEVSAITRRGLIVAQGVEQSAKAIVLCQSQIRQSMRLAGAILNLKPANLTDSSKALWSAVDDGVTHIIATAIEMSKISAQYFGFFLQFNHSFQTFISRNEQKKDVKLVIALENLRNDIREFSGFKKEFDAKLKRLSDEAMKVIKNCVAIQIGVERFNKARIEREKAKEIYIEKKEIYDKKSLLLGEQLETLCVKRASDRALEAKLACQIKQMEDTIERNKEFIAKYREREDKLNALNFDTFQDDEQNGTTEQTNQ